MNSSKKVKPSDLIKLSFDEKEQSKDFKPGEVVKKFKEKYGAGIR
jgi:hypothetical protein